MIIKVLNRKDSQVESFSRPSSGKILKIIKIIKRKDSQEESFSRALRGKILKILKIIKRKDSQEEFSCTLLCCRLLSQFGKVRYVLASVEKK